MLKQAAAVHVGLYILVSVISLVLHIDHLCWWHRKQAAYTIKRLSTLRLLAEPHAVMQWHKGLFYYKWIETAFSYMYEKKTQIDTSVGLRAGV